MSIMQTRRRFLCSAAFAGGASILPSLGARAADQSPDFSRLIREGIVVPKRFDETGEAPAFR